MILISRSHLDCAVGLVTFAVFDVFVCLADEIEVAAVEPDIVLSAVLALSEDNFIVDRAACESNDIDSV